MGIAGVGGKKPRCVEILIGGIARKGIKRPHAWSLPYSTVGGVPTVKVKYAQMGFDWDSGKFLLSTEEDLTPSDRDFAKQMREMQDRAGWADSENRRLKAEVNQLKKRIEELRDQKK